MGLLAGIGTLAAQAPPAPAIVRTALHDFRIETFVDGLVHPFAMAFTPDGDMLVTERPGRLRIVRKGVLLKEPVAGLPDILFLGNGAMAQDGREQAGMRDVVLHPGFATNRLVYISYVKPGADGFGTLAVARGRFERDRMSSVQEIFHATQPGNGTNRSSMWGGRLAFDKAVYPDGRVAPILSVPNDDFDWQHEYQFARPMELPTGTTIKASAWYDNSTANKSNPDPTKDVWWGDQTWEEMMFTSFTWHVRPGPTR